MVCHDKINVWDIKNDVRQALCVQSFEVGTGYSDIEDIYCSTNCLWLKTNLTLYHTIPTFNDPLQTLF